jgi:hypothetical protein
LVVLLSNKRRIMTDSKAKSVNTHSQPHTLKIVSEDLNDFEKEMFVNIAEFVLKQRARGESTNKGTETKDNPEGEDT